MFPERTVNGRPFDVPAEVVTVKLPEVQVVPSFTTIRSYHIQGFGFETTVRQDEPLSCAAVETIQEVPVKSHVNCACGGKGGV